MAYKDSKAYAFFCICVSFCHTLCAARFIVDNTNSLHPLWRLRMRVKLVQSRTTEENGQARSVFRGLAPDCAPIHLDRALAGVYRRREPGQSLLPGISILATKPAASYW